MKPLRTHEGTRGGFTLLESLISLTLLAILFLAVARTSQTASDAFDEGSIQQNLDVQAHRAVERIATLLELAELSTLTPAPTVPLGASDLRFREPLDFAGGSVQWGAYQRLAFELDPGETEDGTDENGDGLVDEGRVLWTQDIGAPGERTVVLCTNVASYLEGEQGNNDDDNGNALVDERGLAFELDGPVLHVHLTLLRALPEGRVITRTVESALRLRN